MLGDCLERLRELPDCSVDSVVTDPPYGLSFMGKKWDYDVPSVEVWAECLRVLKPGGHLLAFAGTRTQHRMAVRIEDAGFEIRDMIAWVYGSGFPKSLDVSKAIDKAAGAAREVTPSSFMQVASEVGSISKNRRCDVCGLPHASANPCRCERDSGPATEAACQWQGWGTALKPALEPITVARKPLGEKTVAANVLEHGTGAINVDGCKVGTEPSPTFPTSRNAKIFNTGSGEQDVETPLQGRWPANLMHDGSNEVVGLFPVTGASKATPRNNGDFKSVAKGRDLPHVTYGHDDNGGSAARFFYCAKASKKDREGSTHPTMKPTDLMRYLCRLVTQPGGVVLDLFMGSGSTGKAAVLEGFQFIGIERELEYLDIATRRIADASPLSGLQNILDVFPLNDTSGHEQPS